MLTLVPGMPDDVIAISAGGRITGQDYDQVLIPAVDQAFARHKNVKLYYEVGETFTGFDMNAAFKDCRVGFSHWWRWKRIALVTDLPWLKTTAQFFTAFMPGQTRIFPTAQREAAKAWIAS